MRSRLSIRRHARSGDDFATSHRIGFSKGVRAVRPLLVAFGLLLFAFLPTRSARGEAASPTTLRVTISNFADHAIELRFTGAICTLRGGTIYRLHEADRQSGLHLGYYAYALPTTTPEREIFGGTKEGVSMRPADEIEDRSSTCTELPRGCATKTVVDLGPSIGVLGQKVLIAYPEAVGLSNGALELQEAQVLAEPAEGSGSDAPRVRAACPFVRVDPGVVDRTVVLSKATTWHETELEPTRITAASVAVPAERHVLVARRGEARIDVYMHAPEAAKQSVVLMGRRSRECLSQARGRVAQADCKSASRVDLVPVEGAPDRHLIRDARTKRCLVLPAPKRGTGTLRWSRCNPSQAEQHWRLLDEVNEADSKISSMYDHVRAEEAGQCLFSTRGKAPVVEECDPKSAHEQWKALED